MNTFLLIKKKLDTNTFTLLILSFFFEKPSVVFVFVFFLQQISLKTLALREIWVDGPSTQIYRRAINEYNTLISQEEKLKQLKEEFMTKLQACCCQIDRILQTNKSTEGWAVGKKVTIEYSKISENNICI